MSWCHLKVFEFVLYEIVSKKEIEAEESLCPEVDLRFCTPVYKFLSSWNFTYSVFVPFVFGPSEVHTKLLSASSSIPYTTFPVYKTFETTYFLLGNHAQRCLKLRVVDPSLSLRFNLEKVSEGDLRSVNL